VRFTGIRRRCPPLCGGFAERQTKLGVSGRDAGGLLPPADRDIDIERVQFDDPGDAAGTLCRQDGCAAAAKRVEDDAIASAAVADQVGDEGHRLNGGMEIELATPGRMETVDPRIIEHIGPIPALTAEPEIIDVQRATAFEHRN